jgi:hypothetical protein
MRRKLVMRSVVNRRFTVVPLLAVAAFGLAACSSSTTGTGTAAPTSGAAPVSSGGSTSSSGGSGTSGGSALAALQPCSLLSSSVLSSLQLSQTDSGTANGARSCSWQKSVDANGLNGYAAGVDIRDSQGLKDVNTSGSTVTSDQIGSHQGQQLQSTDSGDCIVAIGVTNSSRVDVTVNAETDAGKACQVANQLAKVVEPQLPSGS